ncbi:hypothetical protein [Mangrovibacter yixingensis]
MTMNRHFQLIPLLRHFSGVSTRLSTCFSLLFSSRCHTHFGTSQDSRAGFRHLN